MARKHISGISHEQKLWAYLRVGIHIDRLMTLGIDWKALPPEKYHSVDAQKYHIDLEAAEEIAQIQRLYRVFGLDKDDV